MKPPKKTREQLKEETFLCKEDIKTLHTRSNKVATQIFNLASQIDISENHDFYKTKVMQSSVNRVLKKADERNASR